MLCYEYNLVYGVIVYSTHTHGLLLLVYGLKSAFFFFFFGWLVFVSLLGWYILHVRSFSPLQIWTPLFPFLLSIPPILNHDYKSYVHNNNNNTLLSLYTVHWTCTPLSTPSSNASASIGVTLTFCTSILPLKGLTMICLVCKEEKRRESEVNHSTCNFSLIFTTSSSS